MRHSQPYYLSFTCAGLILAMGTEKTWWWNLILQVVAISCLVMINRQYVALIKNPPKE
ncbi:MAG: hypothetical protein IPJ84_06685 [Bdellovibrionales bacterium]|nr:hypothetical protein [Bdellovibrionales bacterium]